jgi:hypothetical protein
MEKLSKIFVAVFTTKVLASNRLLSSGRSSHEELEQLLRLQLDQHSRCSVGHSPYSCEYAGPGFQNSKAQQPTVDLIRFPLPVLFATGKRPVHSIDPHSRFFIVRGSG